MVIIVDLDFPKPSESDLTQLLLPHDPPAQIESTSPSNPNKAQISLHALLGHAIPKTLRFLGRVGKSMVTVLIDSGSSNSFV